MRKRAPLRKLGGNLCLVACLGGSLWHAWQLNDVIDYSQGMDQDGLVRLAKEPAVLVALLLLVVFIQWWHLLGVRQKADQQQHPLEVIPAQPSTYEGIAQESNDHSTRPAPLDSTPSTAAAAAAAAARRPLYSVLPENDGRKLVMVVDGDPVAHMVLEGLLMPQGEFVISRAFSGQEAMQKLDEQPFLPDIMLLETLLPDVDGFSVCRCVREDYSRVELPVIMVSSHNVEEDVHRGLEAGANDFVAKPIRRLELLARIQTHLLLPQLVQAEAESYSNYALLQQMLPPRIIDTLKSGASLIAEQHPEVTILFSDIVGFTNMAADMPTSFIVMLLNALFTRFDALCDTHGVYKVETIGDAYMIVCGHEEYRPDHALRMLAMACDMLEAVSTVSQVVDREVRIRIGMHTGPAYSGVVGIKCPRYCFFGDTVNTASRMESHGFPMCVHYSKATKDAIERGYQWVLDNEYEADIGQGPPVSVSCGERDVKGKGEMKTFLAQVGAWEDALKDLQRLRSCASPFRAMTSFEPSLKPSPFAAASTNTSSSHNASSTPARGADAGSGYLHALMALAGSGKIGSRPGSSTDGTLSSSNTTRDATLSSGQEQLHHAEHSLPGDGQPLLAKLQLPTYLDASATGLLTGPIGAPALLNSSSNKAWGSHAGSSQGGSNMGINMGMQPGTPSLSAFAMAAVARCSTETTTSYIAQGSSEAAASSVAAGTSVAAQQAQASFERVHSDTLSAPAAVDLNSSWQPQRSGSFTAPHESAAARRRNMQLQAYAGTTANVRNGSPLSNPRTPSAGVPSHYTLGNAILGRSRGAYASNTVHVSPHRGRSGGSKQRASGHGIRCRALQRSQTWDATETITHTTTTAAAATDTAAAGGTGAAAGLAASDRLSCHSSCSYDAGAKQHHGDAASAGTHDSSSLAKHLPSSNGWAPLRVQVPLTVNGSNAPVQSAFAEHVSVAAAALAAGVHSSDTSSATSHHASPSPRASERSTASDVWSKLHLTRAKSIARPGSGGGSSSRCSTPRSPQRHHGIKAAPAISGSKPSTLHDSNSPVASAPAASFWQLPWQRARPPSARASSGGGAPLSRSSSNGGGVEGAQSTECARHPTRLSEGGRLQQLVAWRGSDASNNTSNSGSIRSQRLSESGKLQQMAVEQLPDYMREQLDNGLGLPMLIGSYGKEQQRRSPHRSLDVPCPILASGPQHTSVDVTIGRDNMDSKSSM